MRRVVEGWVLASLVCAAVIGACSSFEESRGPSDAGADADPDACVGCGVEAGALDAGVDASDPVVEISPGSAFACARRASGTVVCWGDNSHGKVGQPADGDLACDNNTRCRPVPAQVPGLTDVTHLSAGTDFACARTADGAVKCWGDNRQGQLGTGSATPASREQPEKIAGLPTALDVTAGVMGGCARVSEDGGTAVYCWGNNSRGLVGKAPENVVSGPVRLDGLSGAKSVVLSSVSELGCAILANDSVRCWGESYRGSLGHAIYTQGDVAHCVTVNVFCNPVPMPVGGEELKAAEISVGNHASCARLLGSGEIACWGNNALGMLGRGTNDDADHSLPDVVVGLTGVTALDARSAHACVVASGVVRCWGTNTYGELANGNASDLCGLTACKKSPQTTADLTNVVTVSVSANASYAMTAGGAVLAWGSNVDGRLGHAPGKQDDLASCSTFNGRCNPTPRTITFP